jgi:hypothetical protein
MNVENKKTPEIPADRGLSGYSEGIGKKYASPVFETLAILDNTTRDPVTGVSLPSEESVTQAKEWVDENRL